ncbi:hypothetical protein [Methylosinus sp. Sm6]|uniref:hypothetical protein n=1 Tax=Methylosinus sp. Sm6 TaxID=2866948 RepID=UPI001C993385|nr:hypothetical protein [Methylosinus sp. Sm6]MBY6240134.1 hypothetical protein [Methylosinus sp. Sm6]
MDIHAGLPDQIDMADAEQDKWVRASNDPAIWHEAAIAVFLYLGDKHGFLTWLVQQPDMDRATAGWLFLSRRGSEYLQGARDGFYSKLPDDEHCKLLDALCKRSERLGFRFDRMGVNSTCEEERQRCGEVIAKGKIAAGIVPPVAILEKPFTKSPGASIYECHDGELLSLNFLRASLPEIYGD